MPRFTCPKCSAIVYKEQYDPPGCSCCGFGKQTETAAEHTHTERCKQCNESYGACKGHVLLS